MLTVAPEMTTQRRRRRGSSLTRQRIVEASLHLFSRKGFPRTTIRDIARQAGITDAAIYYHFTNKDELLRELIDAQLHPDQWIAPGVLSTSFRELAREAVHGATRVIEENRELLRIILRESLAGDPVAGCRYSQLMDDWESQLSSRLLSFESTGELAGGEAKTLARQLMYTIIMAFEDRLLLRPDAAVPPAARRQQTLAFLSCHIEWLLSPHCNSPALPVPIPAVDGPKKAS